MKLPHTIRKDCLCSMKDNTSKLLGLEDVIVKNVAEDADGCHVELELPRRKHKCPCCGTETDKIHDYRMQTIKDLPVGGKNTYLHLRKRRYVCESCGKRFYENNAFLPRYYRVTSRMVASIINRFQSTVSATDIAKENNISVSTALRYFDLVDYRCHHLPKVLSIDEFKGNAGGEKFQTILTDAENYHILDILPNRKSADLIRYFLKYPRKERLKVKYIVMDMSSLFRGVAETCFPNATIVADRYHVVRQAVWAMENVRKNVQKKLSPEWRKFFKRSRYLLNKSPEKLTDDERDRLRVLLGISSELEYAYELKNQFLELMHAPNSETGRELIAAWLYLAEIAELPEFKSCTTAIHNWSKEILASLDCGYTNGFTEGCNNKTKVLKRISFGVRSFNRFRNRILHCAAA